MNDDRTINDADEGPRPAKRPPEVYGATLADSDAAAVAGPAGMGGGAAAGDLYKVVREIGEGGMGTLSLAEDVRLGRWVTLKRLSREFADNARLLRRFRTEARSIAALSHFHIVQVYAMAEDDQGPYMAMEYVAGPDFARREGWPAGLPNPPLDLEQYVKGRGVLDAAQAVEVGRKLAGAMAYAHKRGVIHRDIKPANVMLNEDGEPKLADFGLARQTGAEREGVTLPGARMLTLGYGAPEQETDASRVDERADIYALGGTIWFMLTGQNPRFFRESEIAEPLRGILVKALQKDREKRFQTAGELEEALARLSRRGEGAPRLDAGSELVPGQCPRCRRLHALDPEGLRQCRFCEGCGTALFEPCFECGEENAVWSKFCGSCGVDLNAALEKVMDRLRGDREDITWLRRQSRFEDAISLLERRAAEAEDPRLAEFAKWAAETLPKIREEFAAATRDRDRKIQAAEAEIQAHHDEAAVALLEALPSPLQTGQSDDLLAAARARIQQSAKLRAEIAEQAKSGQHKDLRAKVLRFLELRPGSKMRKLLQQIDQREAKEQEAFWQGVKKRASSAAYAQYLAVYPNGRYAALAQEGAAQCRAREDEAFWKATSAQPADPSAYRQYLEKYPDGKHVEEARAIVAPLLRQRLLANLQDVELRKDYLDKRTQAQAIEDEQWARRNVRKVSAIAGLAGGALLGALAGGFAGWFGAVLAGLIMGIAVHFFLDEGLRGKTTRTMAGAVALSRGLAQQKPEESDVFAGGLIIVLCAAIWFVAAMVLALIVAYSRDADAGLLLEDIASGGVLGALTAAATAAIVCRSVKGYAEKAALGPLPWFAYLGRFRRVRAQYLGIPAPSAPAETKAAAQGAERER